MSKPSETLTIGEVARRAGIRTSALRYYERVGLLAAAGRESGRRFYTPGVLQRLDVIELAKEAGFTIAEIAVLLEGYDSGTSPSDGWRSMARRKADEVQTMIRRAEQMQHLLDHGLNCDCEKLEDCVIVEGEGCVTGRVGDAACS